VRCLVEIEDLPAAVNEIHRRLFDLGGPMAQDSAAVD
jgi:hypothetical protein